MGLRSDVWRLSRAHNTLFSAVTYLAASILGASFKQDVSVVQYQPLPTAEQYQNILSSPISSFLAPFIRNY